MTATLPRSGRPSKLHLVCVHYFKGVLCKLEFQCKFNGVILIFFTEAVAVSGGLTKFQAALQLQKGAGPLPHRLPCFYSRLEQTNQTLTLDRAFFFLLIFFFLFFLCTH